MTKKRNAQDATLRNTRSIRAELKDLTARVEAIEVLLTEPGVEAPAGLEAQHMALQERVRARRGRTE